MLNSFYLHRCPTVVRRRRYTERLQQPCGVLEMHTTQPSSSKCREHPSAVLSRICLHLLSIAVLCPLAAEAFW